MDVTRPVTYDLTDYLTMARRHWWVVLAVTLAGVAGAALVAGRTGRAYEASSSVLVQPTADLDTNVVGGRTQGQLNLDTEAQVVRSTAVAVGAAALLHTSEPADHLIHRLTVQVPANTSVLVIRYEGATPQSAQAGSHAFATAYLQNRADSAKAAISAQISALQGKITEFGALVASVNSRIARLAADSPELGNLQSQRSIYVTQINTLTSRANELATTTIAPGKIISEAPLPASPSRPQVPLYLGSGAMAGLLLGAGLAFTRERLDRRVRGAADLVRRTGVPLLAELPKAAAARGDRVFSPLGPGGRVFNRMRNEVLASLRPEERLIVVTGASPGGAATLVAANLAAALARAGNEVVLVGANFPDPTSALPLSRLFDIADGPGLTDVLGRGVSLNRALQRAPRTPRLRVIAAGGTASAAGLLHSDELRTTLRTLRQEVEYVIVEAPSTAAGAEAQSLAGGGDAVILVVEARQTRHAEVADAIEQLRRVGGRLLGAVAVPRLGRGPVVVPAPSVSPAPRVSYPAPVPVAATVAGSFGPAPTGAAWTGPAPTGAAWTGAASTGALSPAGERGEPAAMTAAPTPRHPDQGWSPVGRLTGGAPYGFADETVPIPIDHGPIDHGPIDHGVDHGPVDHGPVEPAPGDAGPRP